MQLERTAAFGRDDTAESRLGKLRTLLAPGAPKEDEFALIADTLSLPSAASGFLALSPQRKRELLFEALLRQLEALARSHPILALFEDAHSIDPTSRELLDLMVERVRRLPILLVITFRPEFAALWNSQPHVTMLALNRLRAADVAALDPWACRQRAAWQRGGCRDS